jgi:hypothetical protein
MQIASAVGEGATAALAIREYLDGMKHVEKAPTLEVAKIQHSKKKIAQSKKAVL